MNGFDIAVLITVCVAFAAVVGVIVYRKIKRKSGGCGCDCASCGKCNRKKR